MASDFSTMSLADRELFSSQAWSQDGAAFFENEDDACVALGGNRFGDRFGIKVDRGATLEAFTAEVFGEV